MKEFSRINAMKIKSMGVKFRQREDTVIVNCPECNGELHIDEKEPWHHCFGDRLCEMRDCSFSVMLSRLLNKVTH